MSFSWYLAETQFVLWYMFYGQNNVGALHRWCHYGDVIMDEIASQTTSLTIVYSTVYSDADQSKHESSASLAFVWGIHRGPVNSPHTWPVTRKMFPFDDVIMWSGHLYFFTMIYQFLTKWYCRSITMGIPYEKLQHCEKSWGDLAKYSETPIGIYIWCNR